MSDAPTKLQRWLDVVAFLASRRYPVSTEELWSNVPAYAAGVDGSKQEKQRVRRTFERDKDELRELGIPIETVQYSINHEQSSGYRLARRDFHLPYLRILREAEGTRPAGVDRGTSPPRAGGAGVFEISEGEAAAALDGLRTLAAIPAFPLARAARSAFRKLAFDLEPDAIAEVPVVYADDPEAVATRDVLHVLADAVRRRKELTFRYQAISSGTEEERRAHGFGLLFQHGRWYLVAHDLDRDGMRMFRAGRMNDVALNTRSPGTPDYEVPSTFSLDDYAGRKAWELGAETEEGTEATVRFRFPRSLWAERNAHGELIEEEEDGTQLRRFVVHRSGPFLRWVLSLAGDARVESPPELRDEFRTLAARVAELHGAGAGE